MKHSTFYKVPKGKYKGADRVYTTIKHTPHHEFLRSLGGKTYQHDDDAALFFIEGMPLKKPIGKRVTELS